MAKAKKAEKTEKSETAQNESLRKSQSDDKKDPGGDAPDEAALKSQEQAREDAEKQSKELAEGKGTKRLKDGAKEDEVGKSYSIGDYDPLTDPIIPSSHIASIVKKELESLGESPTLKALHENKEKASKGK